MVQDIDKDDIEEWRDIDIYPQYQISNIGNVVRKKDGVLLKQYPQKSGYVYVVLDRGEGRHYVPIHRLVCIAFHGMDGYVKGLYVDHINTIRSDNRACNLRWVTAKENANNETTKLNRKRKRKVMKTNELMIGDWVSYGGTPIEVENVHEYYINYQQDIPFVQEEFLIEQTEVEPIPLTQEILEKYGFEKDKYGQMVLNEELGTSEIYIVLQDGDECYWWVVNNELIAKIRYVHQLQHALRLCGIEKEIKL